MEANKNETIVYTYVVADILHTGHLTYLENAKALGDKLIVGVLTDEAVMEKKTKPIVPFHRRFLLVKSLKCVDAVVAQGKYSPLENVKGIKPDILVESSSHTEFPANGFMESIGGRVVIIPYYPEESSTNIKNKIKDASQS
jgi:D-beta-D-heptose 7-phosphate kinase/D-beta-D-heptose 1-phosphate adenosyltransferase